MELLWDQYQADQVLKDFYLQHRDQDVVKCITLYQLCEQCGISNIDLLQINTVGYELEILRTVNFKRLSIRFINYESVLLHERKASAKTLMAANGYTLIDHGQDTLCFKATEPHFRRRLSLMMSAYAIS